MYTLTVMTKPRSQLVSLDDTPYYHCICRCVRRAFLCGYDGDNDYQHRRQWVIDRLAQLSAVFTIDIAAYAIMSNHYHLVVRINRDAAESLTDDEVIERWLLLFNGPDMIHRFRAGSLRTRAELDVVDEIVSKWRSRIGDLSWFMRCLNEHIARLANAEDHCTGHFWEARFKSQALLDETALLSCMAYVDLNPIRAEMTDKPETSDYTAIQARLGITPEPIDTEQTSKITEPIPLMPFAGPTTQNTLPTELPFAFSDYLELVDWTGRIIRDDKRGHIPHHIPPILERLEIKPKAWLQSCTKIETDFYLAIGPIATLKQLCERLQQNWLKGQNACQRLYTG